MIFEALKYLVDLGMRTPSMTLIEQTPDAKRVLVQHGDGTHEYVDALKPLDRTSHTFSTLESFIRFVRGHRSAEVYCTADEVAAYLSVDTNRHDLVSLSLEPAAAFAAFKSLWSPCAPAGWQRLLRSLLRDALPMELAMQMRQLEIGRRGVKAVKIDELGTGNTRSEIGVTVVTSDGKTPVPLKLDWTYEGPMWMAAPDIVVKVEVVLQAMEKGDDLVFQFVPINLDEQVNFAVQSLIGLLNLGLNEINGDAVVPPILVYCGRACWVSE